ncbi:MAG TPA: pilus assembly protein N-terminal domain-containing protein [Oculatellaceae cyanobacterium]
MRKPQLCLAMSASLMLLQVSLLPAQAEDAGSIWQKMAGACNQPTVGKKAATTVTKPKAQVKQAVAVSKAPVADGHSMLLLGKKSDDTMAGGAPAAALTIHPSLTDEVAPAPAAAPTPVKAATKAAPSSDMLALAPGKEDSGSASKQLLAQLAPDQVVAQSSVDTTNVTASPIPPVVTGTVDLEEFKTTNVIDLKVAQSRTFRLKNKIVRTSISDPSIAEPVVVSENQLVLLGKTPGTATLVLWDDAGNSVAIDLRVTRDYGQLQSTLREIDPRIIVKAFSVGGSDRVLLLGDVDHPESVIKAFSASNVFMDDRGMNIQVANSRLINARIGEQGAGGGAGAGGGGGGGQLAQLASVDRYTFFPNLTNNIGKAQVMASDGGRVTSLVKVRKVPLIVLHCTFMEMNTTAARALGVQLGFGLVGRSFQFGVGGNTTQGTSLSTPQLLTGFAGIKAPGVGIQPVQFVSTNTTGTLTLVDGPTGSTLTVPGGQTNGIGQGVLLSPTALLQQAVLFGSPGGASFQPGGLGNLFTMVSSWSGSSVRASLNPTVNGLISQQRARILSEPTLVTISGERASMLAGGEIPILQSIATAGTAQQSVSFEPFGLRLNMIPVLMENGSLNIEVSPEERIPSFQFGLNLAGSTTTIPGFTTRKSQTIVEMKPGQELFISGLITANSGRELDKIPILGEVPVLGALYRSKAFSKNESELVVAIRPEIILPGTPGQLKLPEDIGRVEGPRDLNLFQVEPTVIDERHYISGRDERHQKTSPTLPEGSPIPDNE